MNITVEEVEGLYRRAGVARHSLLASLAGYGAGALVLVLGHVPAVRLGPASSDGRLGMFLFELIFSLFFSVLGWLLFVLPVASMHRAGRWADQVWLVALPGAVIGVAMLAPLYQLFTEPGQGLASPMVRVYGVSAFLNAATAAVACVYLRRRSQQRFRTFLRRNGDSILEGL